MRPTLIALFVVCFFGSFVSAMDEVEKDEINLVFFGPSGSGKSTLINMGCNFASQIKWNDPKLFTIATDFQACNVAHAGTRRVEDHSLGQLRAVTQEPSVYTVSAPSYILHLIDSPGSGDPRGIGQDNKNLLATAHFLTALKGINALCLVMKSSLNRLSVEDRYAFEQVKSIIPQSAKERIFLIVTHEDTDNANIKAFAHALDLPLKHIFYFDNFALTREAHLDFSEIDLTLQEEDEEFVAPFDPQERNREVSDKRARALKVKSTWKRSQREFNRLIHEAKELGAADLAPEMKAIWSLKKAISEQAGECLSIAESIEHAQRGCEKARREDEEATLAAQEAVQAANNAESATKAAFASLEEAIFAYRKESRDFEARKAIQQVIDLRKQVRDKAWDESTAKYKEQRDKQTVAALKSYHFSNMSTELERLQGQKLQLHQVMIEYYRNCERATMSYLGEYLIHYFDVVIRKEENPLIKEKLHRERQMYVELCELQA